MLRKVYSIRDAKAEVFHPPFFKASHGDAERDFDRLTKDPQSMISQYPDDYDLYFLGTFDDIVGKLECLDTPQHIVKAVFLKKPVSTN